jgi:cysteinyl-tRNA synthetase
MPLLLHPRLRFVGLLILAALAGAGCWSAPAPRAQGDAPRARRGIDVSGPFLVFHGRAEQMGDLSQIASRFRLIAVDADPAQGKFSPTQVHALKAGGRNIVLGILNVGFCDRDQTYWRTASDGLLPCAANLHAQIGERSDRPRQVWMDLEDFEYQRLLGEYVAPRLARAGVDGFLLDGFDLLDHGVDDDAPCDKACVAGGLALLASLREEFPRLIFVIEGGLSKWVREGRVEKASDDHVEKLRVTSLIDGIVGEQIYTPSYNPRKEAELLAWKALGIRIGGVPLAVLTQDYVKSCDDVEWAQMVWSAVRSHGFSPAVGEPPVNRPRVCLWPFGS